MLPKGGDAIWGVDISEDDTGINISDKASKKSMAKTTLTPAIVWNNGTDEICPSSTSLEKNPLENRTPTTDAIKNEEFNLSDLNIPLSRTWSMKDTIDYLIQRGGASSSIFATDAKKGWKKKASSKDKRKHWSDPIATPLPRAPSMKVYCLYGTGIPTERSYYYKVSCDKLEGTPSIDHNETCTEDVQNETVSSNSTSQGTMIDAEGDPPDAPFVIDTTAKDDSQNIQSGVRLSDGDGSVPLVSLGYMCQKWSQRKNRHNPSGMKVYTRERMHEAQASLTDPGRGGPASGEHVDILGNVGVMEDVVRIATGFEVDEKVNEDLIVSDLKRIVQTIDEHELGGSNSVFR